MSRHRFFLTEPLERTLEDAEVLLPLSSADLHHAVAVLRVRLGEELDVVEPGGTVLRVEVAAAGPHALLVRSVRESGGAAGGEPHVTLVFGISKGSKNDEIVEGAVEIGVAEVVPVLTARTVVRLDAEKRAQRADRWRRIALAAAKQSKRRLVPEVRDACEFSDALPLLSGYDLVLVAWEEANARGMGVREAIATALVDQNAAATGPSARVAVVVGPEGGLTADEIAALGAIGARTVTLGFSILRAETAAVVLAALALHELGGLGNSR